MIYCNHKCPQILVSESNKGFFLIHAAFLSQANRRDHLFCCNHTQTQAERVTILNIAIYSGRGVGLPLTAFWSPTSHREPVLCSYQVFRVREPGIWGNSSDDYHNHVRNSESKRRRESALLPSHLDI